MGASPGLRCRVPLVEEEPYTLPEAARILRFSRRRVIQMLAAGELEGSQDPETGRWAIPQRAVHGALTTVRPGDVPTIIDRGLQKPPGGCGAYRSSPVVVEQAIRRKEQMSNLPRRRFGRGHRVSIGVGFKHTMYHPCKARTRGLHTQPRALRNLRR